MADTYRTLFQLSKTLLREPLSGSFEYEQLPSFLLERIVKATESARGFIVVSERGQFTEKFHIGFDRAKRSDRKRRFSRSMVREAMAGGELVFSSDVAEDQRFADAASVRDLGRVSVLAAPLRHAGKVYAVIYLEKADGPFDDEQRLLLREFADIAGLTLHLGLERTFWKKRGQQIDERFAEYDFGDMVGRHPKMVSVLERITQVADADAAILIRGETGTGKELIANAIVRNSSRRDKPLVTLHCGALPETLFEAELFGHTRGAFTGADRDRLGRIAQARDGTLFIDEVAEMPASVQAKLLRFFQFGEYQKLGSDRVETVNTRIISATHQNLEALIADGRFRQDLYYRLNVVEIKLPALRERKSDLPLLMDAFFARYWRRDGEPRWTDRARDALMDYAYPGNVRELAHIVERACLLARSEHLDTDVLPDSVLAGVSGKSNDPASACSFSALTNDVLKQVRNEVSQAAVARVEQAFLQDLLDRYGSDVAAAADAAGMQKTYLYKLFSKHGMTWK